MKSIGSVISITGESGEAEPKPPGKPSHSDTLDPMRKFGSLTAF